MVIGLFLRQRRVGNGCEQQRVRTGCFSVLRQRHGLIGAQRADACHQRAPAPEGRGGCLDGAASLLTREIHIDAGAAEDADGIDLRRIQPRDQGGEGLNIDSPGLVSRRDRKSRKSLESCRHVRLPRFDRQAGLQSHWRSGKKSGAKLPQDAENFGGQS